MHVSRLRPRRRTIFIPLLVALFMLVSSAAAQAATINVTTTADTGTGSGDCLTTDSSCSLRQAITAEDGTANGGDTIVLGSQTYNLTQGPDLDITQPLTLSGSGIRCDHGQRPAQRRPDPPDRRCRRHYRRSHLR